MNKETGKYELVGMEVDSMDLDYIAGEGNLFRISEANAEIAEEEDGVSISTVTSSEENSSASGSSETATSQTKSNGSFKTITLIVSICLVVLLAAAGIGGFVYKKNKRKDVQK